MKETFLLVIWSWTYAIVAPVRSRPAGAIAKTLLFPDKNVENSAAHLWTSLASILISTDQDSALAILHVRNHE
jgi:hypothetical protein